MAKPTGFKEYKREEPSKQTVQERIQHYNEFIKPLPPEKLTQQAARCMDCGIPYCHGYGCPLGNLIPDWNDMVYQGRWKEALDLLHATNNFPEFTGKICPAPCECACTLAINNDPVSIKLIEMTIIEHGWAEGWVTPIPPKTETGKKVAVVGSGPAGLAAAQQLRRAGHTVTLFEKADRMGGLLRYGIPDFKLEKWLIDRRLKQMEEEGVIFETSVDVGYDISAKYLTQRFDAICITSGARVPRDLTVEGRDLGGIHFAMDFLTQQNKLNAGDKIDESKRVIAKDKVVVVIGGGDTGSDCVGTSIRHGAKKVYQFELLPQPPEQPNMVNPDWPYWPIIMRTSTSHQEGCERRWSIMTQKFSGNKTVQKLHAVELQWSEPDENGRRKMDPIPGTEFSLDVDLVLLAMGFVHPEHGPLEKDLGLLIDNRGNIKVNNKYQTSVENVFASGDSVMGASLVVKAIAQGREMARCIDEYLMGYSELPSTGNV
ncbi:MAG: glutamate synthase subunit beta [Candidatus Auribacterota bacterium]